MKKFKENKTKNVEGDVKENMNNELELVKKDVTTLKRVSADIVKMQINTNQTMSMAEEALNTLTEELRDRVTQDALEQITYENNAFKMEVNQQISKVKNDTELSIMNQGKEFKKDVDEVKDMLLSTTIDRHQQVELTKMRKERISNIVGTKGTITYDLFYSPYLACLTSMLKKHLVIDSYKDIALNEFETAKDYIRNWNPSEWFQNKIIRQYKIDLENGLLDKRKEVALNKYISA
jgi:hypothetical protein